MRGVVLFLFILFFSSAFGQDEKGSISKYYWQLQLDNDISSQTDRQYTAGFLYEQTGPKLAKFYPSKFLLFQESAFHTGLKVELKLYTPKDIFTDAPPTEDRPYASTALFYLFNRSLIDNKHWVESRLGMGLIGPSSQSWRLQNAIHALTPYSEDAVGWKYQVADAFLIQYELMMKTLLVQVEGTALIGGSEARLGSGFVDASLFAEWRLGWLPDWKDDHLSIKKQHRFYLFIRPRVNVIGYNVTLQSSMIGSSSELLEREIENWTGQVQAGFFYRWSRTEMEFSQSFLSPEYANGPFHSWGSLRLRFYL